MEDEAHVIRRQMQETRSSLQDKLETLEQQVTGTVKIATEAATETVQSVKDAVKETVENVKGTVEETVESVKDTFNLSKQVHDHPCAMFFGAVAVGYFGARMLMGASTLPSVPPGTVRMPGGPGGGEPRRMVGNGMRPALQPERPGIMSHIAEHYKDELSKLQGLALGVVGSVVREMLTSAAPPALATQVTDIVDSFTTKLGGKPISGSVFEKPAVYTGNSRFSGAENI
jgi:hypothetical protein